MRVERFKWEGNSEGDYEGKSRKGEEKMRNINMAVGKWERKGREWNVEEKKGKVEKGNVKVKKRVEKEKDEGGGRGSMH